MADGLSLSAGSHTVKLQVYGDTSTGTFYGQTSTAPNSYFLNIEVIERKLIPLATASVNKVQLDYLKPSDTTALSLTATTWVDIEANQTFTVDDSQSLVEIVVRGLAFIVFGSATTEMGLRLVIDSGGTTQNIGLGGAYTGASGNWTILQGIAPVTVSGLAAGSHTVKLQAYNTGAFSMNYYCRPASVSPVEFLSIKVIERKVVATGASGTLDMARIAANSVQSIPNSSFTQVTLGTVDQDTNTLTGTANAITIKTTGTYRVTGAVSFNVAGGSRRLARVLVNGTQVTGGEQGNNSSAFPIVLASDQLKLNAGDVVTLAAYQDSGGAINTGPSSGTLCAYLEVQRTDGYAVNPMTGVGDMIVGTTNGAPQRLAVGTSLQLLGVVSGAPGWVGDTAWTNFTYANSWVDYDATTYYPGSYRKDPSGWVHLRGLIKLGSSAGATITTLPAGYRPGKNVIAVGWNGGTSGQVATRINIGSNGTIAIDTQGLAAGTASNSYQSLEGISFFAEA